jgi:hypothetical protein
LVLVVEGPDDVRRLRRLLPDVRPPDLILDGNGARGVQRTCRTLSSGFDQPHLGVCDRDLMSNEEVEALRRRVPGLFVMPSRCLENELLHPPLLARALDMTGHEVSEAEVRVVLRQIADEQYDQVHATMVDRILYREYTEPIQREDGEPPIGLLRREYEARRDSAQNRVQAVTDVAIRVESDLKRRWSAEHLVLLDGKAALPQVAQQLAPGLKGGRGLETAVLRHAIDNPPPGIVALRSEIAQVVR